MNSVVLSTHTAALFAEAVESAAELLRAGELVALPTETVYGLAANAWDAAAVARIYEVKGRPARNPIIVHVAGLELARECVASWPPLADKLAGAFWPGPLTLVLPRSPRVPDVVTAGGPTVGVRWPSHPFIQAVIRACGFPLAAPSANPANQVSPTNAEHVRKDFEGKIPLIVDGGPSQVGLESTVLDLAAAPPAVLRPGMIHAESLLAVMGEKEIGLSALNRTSGPETELRSPGMLRKHYSPRARLVVLHWTDEEDLKRRIAESLASEGCASVSLRQCHVIAHTRLPKGADFGRVASMERDPAAFARDIYAQLHQSDALGARLIIVEAPPPGEDWRGITDRLARAGAE